MSREDFINRYKHEVESSNIQKNRDETRSQQRKYTAQKGTAASIRRKNRKLSVQFAALLMAAVIGAGGVSLKDYNVIDTDSTDELKIEDYNFDKLGMSGKTVQLLKKYEEYFSNFKEEEQYDLTNEQVLDMINEIESLHFSVVKEKIGTVLRENASDIKMYYGANNSDGGKYTKIIVAQGKYSERIYNASQGTFLGLGSSNDIPKELVDVIWQLSDLEKLEEKLSNSRISRINAVKELKYLYNELEELATGEFIKDEKDNIRIIHYSKNKIKSDKENEEERN